MTQNSDDEHRTNQEPEPTQEASDRPEAPPRGSSRREFFAQVGAASLTAGGLLAGAGSSEARADRAHRHRHVPDYRPERRTYPALSNFEVCDPALRKQRAFQLRVQAAEKAYALRTTRHETNGDEYRFYGTFIGNFSKTLPHNDFGEVDPAVYKQLLQAIRTGRFSEFEALAGDGGLANPLGALFYSMDGPDPSAIAVEPPPSIASAEFASQMAQLYWMALLRDVNFDEYDSHADALDAREDLARFPGYFTWGPNSGGDITAQDLFRPATRDGTPYPGTDKGPLVSQFLLRPYSLDGDSIDGKLEAREPGQDFLTDWFTGNVFEPPGGMTPFPSFGAGGYLATQRGEAAFHRFAADPSGRRRYPINTRDLGFLAASDRINSVYLRAAGLLGFNAPVDSANPYVGAMRQGGFATFGLGHLIELLGKVHKAERHAWYTKWCVNRYLRPEVGAARVHQWRVGNRDYPIVWPEDAVVLDRVFAYNEALNTKTDEGTYLLPQLLAVGSPSHPSFTAGHAITAGACVTLLKAWLDLSLTYVAWDGSGSIGTLEAVQTTADGMDVEPYTGDDLSLEGELNKLCHNLSWGRDMSGVHWPADNYEGNAQGEALAIAILREEMPLYPEDFTGFHLRKFDGTEIVIA